MELWSFPLFQVLYICHDQTFTQQVSFLTIPNVAQRWHTHDLAALPALEMSPPIRHHPKYQLQDKGYKMSANVPYRGFHCLTTIS